MAGKTQASRSMVVVPTRTFGAKMLSYSMTTYTISKVAEVAGVAVSTVTEHRKRGLIPAPQPQGHYKKRYTQEQADQIVNHFSKPLAQIREETGYLSHKERALQQGLYNMVEASK